MGTATARELSIRYPTLKLALVEKENKLGKTDCFISLSYLTSITIRNKV